MRGKDLLSGMSFLDERFINEAETAAIKKHMVFVGWKRYGSLAACFVLMILLAFFVSTNILKEQNAKPLDNMIVDKQNDIENASVSSNEIHINMQDMFLNEIGTMLDAAKRWYDPELYDEILWDKDEIQAYYGKDLTPDYIPDGLSAANGNGTARVFAEKNGKIVEDTVWLSFYHAYYEDGSPKLTEGVAATKGFTIKASKIGLINDCIYLLPENEVKTSNIEGIEVTFGYRSMEYGPYDPDTHEPSGYYDLYVAEFVQDDIEYYIVADQMEFEEIVKVVASIIFEENKIIIE